MITIVTINYNNAAGLRTTLESALSQSWKEFEHIVIDGGSDDGSVDLLRSEKYNISSWMSEPDSGIYDAQNKGAKLSTKPFILFLNSGDHFVDSSSLDHARLQLDDSDLQSFDIIVKDFPGINNGKAFVKQAPDFLSFSFFFKDTLPHPSTFIKRRLFEDHGYYDTTLKIVADWKAFILWACRHNCSYRHHPTPLSVFYCGGVSSHSNSRLCLLSERDSVLTTEFPAFVDDARDLIDCRPAGHQLKALRASKIIKALQTVHLLWKF